MTVDLDGKSLRLEDVIAVARTGSPVAIAPAAVERMREARAIVDEHVSRGAAVYGTTTGVGALKRVPVFGADARSFSRRMLDSCLVGHGEPVGEERVRATMLRLANTLVKPAVGVRPELAQLVVDALNERRHPAVRLHGSVGQADMVPLAELAVGLIEPAAFELEPGEGLALIDNNAFSTGIAALAVHDLTVLSDALEIAGALAMEAFGANPSVLHPIVAESAHPGLQLSVASLRSTLAGSSLWEPGVPRNLQDPLTFRTLAQVLGALRDATSYTVGRLAIELNKAQNNPLVVVDERTIVSVGCFDSQALASALDFARIALAPALTASVERVQKLLSSTMSGLAPGLAEHPELADDGFFEFGVAAQAVAAEARLLAQPVSFDLTSTSQAEGIEDRTCMTPLAARRLAEMVALGEHVAAIELVIAARGIDQRRPVRLGDGTAHAHSAVRAALPDTGRVPRSIEPVRALIRERALRQPEP